MGPKGLSTRGVWGHAPSKVCNSKAFLVRFLRFSADEFNVSIKPE